MVAVADTAPQALSTESTEQDEEKKRIKQAEAKVRLREVSRARVHLTSSGLAPGTPETLAELTDPELRNVRPPRIPYVCVQISSWRLCGQRGEAHRRIYEAQDMSTFESLSMIQTLGASFRDWHKLLREQRCHRKFCGAFASGA